MTLFPPRQEAHSFFVGLLIVLPALAPSALAYAPTDLRESNAVLVAQMGSTRESAIPPEILALQEEAKNSHAKGDLTKAAQIQRTIVNWANLHLRLDDPFRIEALNSLGGLLAEADQFLEALSPSLEALELLRLKKSLSSDTLRNLAWTLQTLGSIFNGLGDYQQAIEHLEEAKLYFKDLIRPYMNSIITNKPLGTSAEVQGVQDLGNYALAMRVLGASYIGIGNQQEALAATEFSVEIYRILAETVRNSEYPYFLAGALRNQSAIYQRLEKYVEAIQPLEESIQILQNEARLKPDNKAYIVDIGMNLSGLAALCDRLGQKEKALSYSSKTTSIFKILASSEPAFRDEYAFSLLVNSQIATGSGEARTAMIKEAVSIFRALSKDSIDYLDDLARALLKLSSSVTQEGGTGSEAISSAVESVAIFKTLSSRNSFILTELGSSLRHLSQLLLSYRISDHNSIFLLADQALAIHKSLSSVYIGEYIQSLYYRAELQLLTADPSPAFVFLKDAISNEISFLQRQLPLLPEGQRLAMVERSSDWQIPFTQALQGELGASLAFFTRLNRHGLLQDIQRNQIRLLRDGPHKRIYENLIALNNRLSSPGLTAQQAEELQNQRSKAESQIYLLLPELKPRLVDLQQVAQQLPSDGILVEFQLYDFKSLSTGLLRKRGYLALVLTPKGAIHAVPLGEAADVEQLIQTSLQKAATPPSLAG